MADDAALTAFLSSLGSSQGNAPYADINQFEKTAASNSIYNQLAAPVLAARFNTNSWSPGETAAMTAGQAFLGTVLSKLGQNDAASQLASTANSLKSLYADPLGTAIPEGVDPTAFNQLRLSAVKSQSDRETVDAQKHNDLQERLFVSLLDKNPGIALKLMPDTAEKLGVKVPKVEAPQVEAPSPVEDTGGPSLTNGQDSSFKKFLKYQSDALAAGVPPTQAAVTARQQIEGEIKANTKSFDEAKAAREYGQKLLDIASQAKSGIAQAGVTGNLQGLRHAADYVGNIFGNETSAQRLQGDQVLAGIGPDIARAGRTPGAVSDYETRMLIASGPSVNNTPETNNVLAQKMEDLGKLNLDYADFLDAYRQANSGSTIGAQKKWAEYRQAFPLFKGDSANIQLNTDRPSWQEYFAGVAKPSAAVSTGLPGVGGTFQGEKVLSVRRIK